MLEIKSSPPAAPVPAEPPAASHVAISVKHLSKVYKLYHKPIDRLKEALNPFHRSYHKDFHALREVNFDVSHGETVGVIGRNGSGKSTLLQIICGTLSKSSGQVIVNGRIAPLLSLGVGFFPDYTGRENVYLNGALLGLTRQQMDDRYQAITDFAGIGEFMDQPIRIYSSGMRVRIAFAVAINVEADILVVDEALAVGDEVFQRKCFSRIQEFRDRGGTILFVSHSAQIVMELCDRAILLDRGELLLTGAPKSVFAVYHKMLHAPRDKAESLRERLKDAAADGPAAAEAFVETAAPRPGETANGPDEALFDPRQMSVVFAEQRRQQCGVVEIDLHRRLPAGIRHAAHASAPGVVR